MLQPDKLCCARLPLATSPKAQGTRLPLAPARKASNGTGASGKDARLACKSLPARPACVADCAYLPIRVPQATRIALWPQKKPRLLFLANLL